jgi:hypothetical protein
MMKKNHALISGLLLQASLLVSHASIVPAFQAPSVGPANNPWGPNDPVNLGMVFTPVANTSVDALGFYDALGVTTGETVTIS